MAKSKNAWDQILAKKKEEKKKEPRPEETFLNDFCEFGDRVRSRVDEDASDELIVQLFTAYQLHWVYDALHSIGNEINNK